MDSGNILRWSCCPVPGSCVGLSCEGCFGFQGEKIPVCPQSWEQESGLIQDAAQLPMPDLAIIRFAQSDDAPAVAKLLTALGYPSPVEHIERRIAGSAASIDTAVYVAESVQCVVGVISFHCIPLFHADGALGRITSLVVDPGHRQRGIGRLLVAAAEEFGRAHGCSRIEVTSGDRRPEAHAFYEHLGYQLDCRRFIKHTREA
jgi:GNAT superfamily N-acetyltransferase